MTGHLFPASCCMYNVLSHLVMSDSCNSMDYSLPVSSVHGDPPGKNTGVGCRVLFQGSNPGFPHCRLNFYCLNHQGSPRILGWVAYPFSSGSCQLRNQTGSPALQVDSLPAELLLHTQYSFLQLHLFLTSSFNWLVLKCPQHFVKQVLVKIRGTVSCYLVFCS